jgi:hypothetical protein
VLFLVTASSKARNQMLIFGVDDENVLEEVLFCEDFRAVEARVFGRQRI